MSFNFMTAVTVHSDFGAQENKVCHCFYFFPIYFPIVPGDLGCLLIHVCAVLSRSVMSESLQPYRLYLLGPWGFSKQEYWSGLPCSPPGDLPNPEIKPRSPALQADSLSSEPPGKPKNTGVGSLSLLQEIFPTQESNQGHDFSFLSSLLVLLLQMVISINCTLFILYFKLLKWNVCLVQKIMSHAVCCLPSIFRSGGQVLILYKQLSTKKPG